MEKQQIAIVDDDPHILDIVEAYLRKEGYQIITMQTAEEALELWKVSPPHLWILDIMLPGMNGYEFCRQIRQETGIPIIMISARDEEVDKILGLELGGDDYLTKPFSPRELVARVNRALRRWKQLIHQSDESRSFTWKATVDKTEGGSSFRLLLDADKRQVFWEGGEIEVTSKEFRLLQFLSENPDRAFSREDLLLLIWGDDYFGSDRVVDDLVRRIRRKIEGLPLETVWGFGYRYRNQEGN